MGAASKRHRAFIAAELLVVLAILITLVGLLLPAVQRAREAGSRTACENNLRQIGNAIYNYHSMHNGFPPGKWGPAAGVSHCWLALLLPYIEQEAVFRRYDLTVTWNDSKNDSATPGPDVPNQTQIALYLCPSAPHNRRGNNYRGVTDYAAVGDLARPNPFLRYAYWSAIPAPDPTWVGVLGYNVKRRVIDIRDGCAYTLMVAECAGRNDVWQLGRKVGSSSTGSWANPDGTINVSGFDIATGKSPGAVAVNGWNNRDVYSFHPGVAGALFADASVHFLSANTNLDTLYALTTRSGGEIVPESAFE
jgi:type II secretory pathway pseudopilin PulG